MFSVTPIKEQSVQSQDLFVLEHEYFQKLLDVLVNLGYQTIGPTVKEGTVVYDRLISVFDLPTGWTDVQNSGTYRLTKNNDKAFFGYVTGPHSWKKYLLPPISLLWKAKRNGNNFQILSENKNIPKYAFIGVRSCDIHAISIQDKVFINGQYIDTNYKEIRKDAFILAVNCGKAGGTCFCASMNTGPKVSFGFDLAMTEVVNNDSHHFIVETGTELGLEILLQTPHRKANENDKYTADTIINNTASQMGRTMDTTGIKDLLYSNYEHPQWDDVAKRCLTCANCTMVCPTCFCTTVEDVTDLTGEYAERVRKWDSCFTRDFSYIHGGSVRSTSKSRYRQWITHKLATWIDQFGTSGCVGCGRCITWCPVAIDITEEIHSIRKTLSADKL